MSKKIQDLEQELLRCWEVTLDLKLLAEIVNDGSNNTDTVNGLAEVYELRFNKAWDTFEKVAEEYYAWKPREVNFDDWGDEASEKRQDIIKQNSNDGLHYE
jgi:hypothetical protein